MRRKSKKRNGVLKVLTAAAVVTAMSAGTLTAFASTDPDIMVDLGDGNVLRLTVEQLESSDHYRNLVMNAFNNANSIIVQDNGNGTWSEVSATVDAAALEVGGTPYDIAPGSPFYPYAD